MSERSDEIESAIPAPRETSFFYGHTAAEATLLSAYKSGHIPHAWLIGGAQGIGKATLAYRMAKFVLGHPDPSSVDVQSAANLDVAPDNIAARKVAAGSHGGLLTLARTLNEKGVLRSVITVDESRETIPFFGSTAAIAGWRICIVDTVDELNANASNALLKILEEPPAQSLFFLVSHAPARVLATIQSRCRKLMLRPLSAGDVLRAAAQATQTSPPDPALREASEAADGSVARALALLDGEALGLQQRTSALLESLPHVDPRALHALGDALPLNDRVALRTFMDTIDRWLTAHLHAPDVQANLPRLARLAQVWEKINQSARETEAFNLERKPLVFSVFGLLAEATMGSQPQAS
ncbi:MAG: DNA polymerase III subunit delta' [Xanthobacteraceae bacterium]|nr:DNA polymerase III subunit delta' [Xanthobacteraceae bacterium]